jgi:hypothetical protein
MTDPTPKTKSTRDRERKRARKLRAQIDGDALLALLQDFALGNLPPEKLVSKVQVDTARYLLDKVVPKVAEDAPPPPQPMGSGGQPIFFSLTWNGEPMPGLQFNQVKVIENQPDGEKHRLANPADQPSDRHPVLAEDAPASHP